MGRSVATCQDIDSVAACIADAFATDPIWSLALARDDGRKDHHRPYWRNFVESAMRFGGVHRWDSGAAAPMPLLLATICVVLISGCTTLAPRRVADRPNILLILVDDLGHEDLGIEGSADIKTPNIDRLAANSIRFEDGHTSASVCSPSRAGLMTGRYQQRFGHEANMPPSCRKKCGMALSEVTIGERLRLAGYRTGLVGKWHLGTRDSHYPTARGFDYFYGFRTGSRGYFYDARNHDRPRGRKRIEENGEQTSFDGYLTDAFGTKAIEFLREESESPFFLFLSFSAPHGPLQAREEDLARFSPIEDENRRTYAAMVWALDRAVGRVIAELDRQGVADDTLIWFLSDNGGEPRLGASNLPLAGKKGMKFEGGIRVPFFMQWKARFPQGGVFNPMVSALDILPTSIAAAGGSATGDNATRGLPLDGVNLLPYLSGENATVPHQKLYWHRLWFSAMRDGPWKFIYARDYGYALYDLDEDIAERHDLSRSHPGRVATMAADLDDWKRELAEPRWREANRHFKTLAEEYVRVLEGADGR